MSLLQTESYRLHNVQKKLRVENFYLLRLYCRTISIQKFNQSIYLVISQSIGDDVWCESNPTEH